MKTPLAKQYAELTIREADRPRRIVEELRVGGSGATARWPCTTSRGVRERDPRGADHVLRAGHDLRPAHGDRRRRLDPASVEEVARAAADHLRGTAEQASCPAQPSPATSPIKAPRFGAPTCRHRERVRGRDRLPRRYGRPLISESPTPCSAPWRSPARGGKEDADELGREEATREGLAVEMGGLTYNVFITRQLNPKDAEDRDYYRGGEPGPDNTLYGVFLQVCNHGTNAAAGGHRVHGHGHPRQGLRPDGAPGDQPVRIPRRHGGRRELHPGEEQRGVERGPTAGAMLLFNLPLESTENRPLELKIARPRAARVPRTTSRAPSSSTSEPTACATPQSAASSHRPNQRASSPARPWPLAPPPARTSITATAILGLPPGRRP